MDGGVVVVWGMVDWWIVDGVIDNGVVVDLGRGDGVLVGGS